MSADMRYSGQRPSASTNADRVLNSSRSPTTGSFNPNGAGNQDPHVKRSDAVKSKRALAPESLLSPTIDFPKPKSIGRAFSESSDFPLRSAQMSSFVGHAIDPTRTSHHQEANDEYDGDDDEDSEEKMRSRDDPLAAQVWRLYSNARDSLPNAQRLENLTWRMMAMALHKRGDGKQSSVSAGSAASPCSPRFVEHLLLNKE